MPDPLPSRLIATVDAGLVSAGQAVVPYLPRRYWERVQRRRIRRMVRHARDTVPFYREALDSLGLGPEDFRDPADLLLLPPIGRDDYAAQPEAFQSLAAMGDRIPLRTSGSSGRPAAFWHDRRSMRRNIAYGRREAAARRGAAGRHTRPLTVVFRHPGSQYNRVQRFYDDALYVPARGARSRLVPTDRPLEENIELLHRLRPRVVSAHGSYLGEILLHPDTLQAGGWRPAVGVYTADSMADHARRALHEEHGILIQSLYRSGEALKIAFECEAENGLHIHSDLVHLAIVDDGGNAVPTGETGHIVLSNLLNRATVLLNYRTGDRGALSGGSCPCGRGFPLLERLEGRSGDLVRLPSGVVLEATDLTRVFRDRADVARFQIVRTGPVLEVRVRPAPGADLDCLRQEVAAAYRRLLGSELRVRVTLADLPRVDGEKWRPVIVAGESGDGASE